MISPRLLGRFARFSTAILAIASASSSLFAYVPKGDPQGPRAPLAACVVGQKWLALVTREDEIWLVSLDTGEQRLLSRGTQALAVAPADVDSFWVISNNGAVMLRMALTGRVVEQLVPPERVGEVVTVGGDIVVARMPFAASGLLLWRGRPASLQPWALPVERFAADPASVALANMVAVDSDGERVAVVWRLLRSEMALLDRDGRLRAMTTLPYYGASWAPLGFDPSLLSAGDVTVVPKPYADVAMANQRVWCLSGQEGPWRDNDTRRGRHVVEVDLDGRIVHIHELRVDGCQLVVDGASRVLVVDCDLGLHPLPGRIEKQP